MVTKARTVVVEPSSGYRDPDIGLVLEIGSHNSDAHILAGNELLHCLTDARNAGRANSITVVA